MSIRVNRKFVESASAPLPAGAYRSRIVKVDDVDASTGSKMWKLRVEHILGKRVVSKFYQFTYARADNSPVEMGAGLVNDIVSATDAWNEDDTVNEERLLGTPLMLALEVERQEGYPPRNVLEGADVAAQRETAEQDDVPPEWAQ